jgi:hypothetical protein
MGSTAIRTRRRRARDAGTLVRMDALQFNQSLKLGIETIKKIQRTVGVSADGHWGPRTIAGVRTFQAARGLNGDGRCSPATIAKFQAEWVEDDNPADDDDLDDRTEDDTPLEPELDDPRDHHDDFPFGNGFTYFTQAIDIDANSSGDHVIALLNDLFAFGFTNEPPMNTCGKQGVDAIVAFQQAAMTPHRIHDFKRIQVAPSFKPGKLGVVDAATRAEIASWKRNGYRWQAPGEDFIERRVRVRKLGTLPGNSMVLVEVPGTGGKPRKLHSLAAAALASLRKACESATGVELLVQSGWRRHRWASREQYEKELIKRYGSVSKGVALLSFDSPHETGLAVDFGSGGLEAKSATTAKQRQTPVHQWLKANAYRFGFHPYEREPWHWEFPLSKRAWTTGRSDWRLSDDA